MQKNPGLRRQFWQLGRSAPFPSPHLFCFPQPDRRGFQQAAGVGAEPTRTKAAPHGLCDRCHAFSLKSTPAVDDVRLVLPSPGADWSQLRFERQGVLATRSRGARLSRTHSAPGARRVLGSDRHRGRGAALRATGPPPGTLCAAPGRGQPRPGRWHQFSPVRVSGGPGSDSSGGTCAPAQARQPSWLLLGVGIGKSLVLGGS